MNILRNIVDVNEEEQQELVFKTASNRLSPQQLQKAPSGQHVRVWCLYLYLCVCAYYKQN